MKECDAATISTHHIPSLVLMERAALSVSIAAMSHFPDAKNICAICGPGNNGGDGVAISRLLHLKGRKVTCVVLGDMAKYSTQLQEEIDIAQSYGLEITDNLPTSLESYDLIIDAMFGIGLTRGLSSVYAVAASLMNASHSPIISVDIPSGFDTDTGKCLGDIGVLADLTVTFAYMKKGLVLGDCKSHAGQIHVADVGIYVDHREDTYAYIIDDSIFSKISQRPVDANKGTCGKILIVAGSENIYGACYLSAKAALVAGSGLVKVYTHKNNIGIMQKNLPEAMYTMYEDYNETSLLADMKWADVILIGPGLGQSITSKNIVNTILENSNCPVIIDADGINLVAKEKSQLKELCKKCPVIMTPHLKEMERLTDTPVSTIKYDIENIAKTFAQEYNCTIILKDATTVIASPKSVYYVISGNESLATPGSGDVLAGIVASLTGQQLNSDISAAPLAAAHMHGKAGSLASEKLGTKGVLASDIIDAIPQITRS